MFKTQTGRTSPVKRQCLASGIKILRRIIARLTVSVRSAGKFYLLFNLRSSVENISVLRNRD